jgi:hypothetical protein
VGGTGFSISFFSSSTFVSPQPEISTKDIVWQAITTQQNTLFFVNYSKEQ